MNNYSPRTEYWEKQHRARSDRREAGKRLKSLMVVTKYDTKFNKALLKSLALTPQFETDSIDASRFARRFPR